MLCNSPRYIAVCDHEDGAHVAFALPHGGQDRELSPGVAQHAGQRLVAVHAGVAAAALEAAAVEAEEDRRGGRVGAGAVRSVATCEIKGIARNHWRSFLVKLTHKRARLSSW